MNETRVKCWSKYPTAGLGSFELSIRRHQVIAIVTGSLRRKIIETKKFKQLCFTQTKPKEHPIQVQEAHSGVKIELISMSHFNIEIIVGIFFEGGTSNQVCAEITRLVKALLMPKL